MCRRVTSSQSARTTTPVPLLDNGFVQHNVSGAKWQAAGNMHVADFNGEYRPCLGCAYRTTSCATKSRSIFPPR